jgi:NAD-dependent deacetylase
MADDAHLDRLAALLRDARQIVVLTGAGISTESGIPDFRGPQGLWTKDPSAERKATIQHYVHDAEHRRDVWRNRAAGSERFGGEPNAGHLALAELERRANLHTLVTQNVDGLHQAAGSAKLVELHGNIQRVKCSRGCGVVDGWSEPSDGEPPRCTACGAFLRPDVVWFDEMLPPGALEQAEIAVDRCDLLLVVGTAAEVYPAAGLPGAAMRQGATVVEINPQPTALSDDADHVLRGPAGIVLPSLVAAVWTSTPA